MDLMSKLVNGEITMTDDSLQNDPLTWMRDEDYNVFIERVIRRRDYSLPLF